MLGKIDIVKCQDKITLRESWYEPVKTVLLTLGRLPKALALARACRAVGCRVLVADPFRWHLCRPSRAVARCYRVPAPNADGPAYLDALGRIVRRERVDMILPVSEEALHVAPLGDALGSSPPPSPHVSPHVSPRLWCAPRNHLRRLHNKCSFIEHAARRGLAVPETYAAGDPRAVRLAQRVDYVEKPVHSCSGIGLRLARAGQAPLSASAETVIQRRLDGDVLSSLSLVEGGREIASVFYRGRVFTGTVAICFERVDDAPSAQRWVRDFLKDSDYSGFLAFDFVVAADGVARAIECNPRATSGVHFFDETSLGEALLNPAAARGVALTAETRFQWAYSTWTEACAAVFRPREFRRRFAAMRRARDVVWSPSDPLPFLLMTPMSWEILWPAMTSDLTLGEATQRDIAWFGSAP